MCDLGVLSGSYAYTADLLMLASRRAISRTPTVSGWSHIQSPIVADAWAVHLAGHPDQAYVGYLVQGLQEGFRIGFQYGHPHVTAHQPICYRLTYAQI